MPFSCIKLIAEGFISQIDTHNPPFRPPGFWRIKRIVSRPLIGFAQGAEPQRACAGCEASWLCERSSHADPAWQRGGPVGPYVCYVGLHSPSRGEFLRPVQLRPLVWDLGSSSTVFGQYLSGKFAPFCSPWDKEIISSCFMDLTRSS